VAIQWVMAQRNADIPIGNSARKCLAVISKLRRARSEASEASHELSSCSSVWASSQPRKDGADVNWPRVLLRIWIVVTIGWLGLAGYDFFMRWPEYYRFFRTPDNLLIGAMVPMHLTESLGFALVPPIVLLVIGWLVLWSVRGFRT
jgi:hypothetical protein